MVGLACPFFVMQLINLNNVQNLNPFIIFYVCLKLRIRKSELLLLYQNLEHMRGFSQDCEASVLHRLIYKLISLTSSEDSKVLFHANICVSTDYC